VSGDVKRGFPYSTAVFEAIKSNKLHILKMLIEVLYLALCLVIIGSVVCYANSMPPLFLLCQLDADPVYMTRDRKVPLHEAVRRLNLISSISTLCVLCRFQTMPFCFEQMQCAVYLFTGPGIQ
jgi:hypothetical protein